MSYLLYLHSQRFSRWMDSGLGYCGDSTNAKNADKSENRRGISARRHLSERVARPVRKENKWLPFGCGCNAGGEKLFNFVE